ncbi:Phenazine biosynthesis-like domain-containing protein [Hypsibius exemplaris]|uniref:Phenazine biosynthesis-like domain-containing protein n=1 Tax=Hypsibius exemplaris TaxID=2072580 RepID=A0A1W0XEV5_HYPEX|nr:Phenazine biosynthesis-like domain-containing protein [Hypsibius exemplaris]
MELNRGVTFPMYIVDAFASEALTGNPAVVCVTELNTELSDVIMQRIAAEMNQTTTAFVRRSTNPITGNTCLPSVESEFILRWFTPTTEIPLCGHATLATSAVIFEIYKNLFNEIKFQTESGIHTARLKDGFIELDFPINLATPLSPVEQADIQPLLEVCTAIAGADSIVAVRLSQELRYLLVHLSDGVDLANLEVDPNRLLAAGPQTINLNGVILTVRGGPSHGTESGSSYDFCTRFFSPWRAIPEDPVCGSAHTVLAPYWTEVLGKAVNRARMVSKRGGDLLLNIRENGRIGIAGTYVSTLRLGIKFGQRTVIACSGPISKMEQLKEVTFPVYMVDAFASEALTGNPAVVCVLEPDTELSSATMQHIAAEMNQTTTAFIRPFTAPTLSLDNKTLPNNEFSLRWFTPTTETPLCGHATLASSAVIFEINRALHEINFNTKSGIHKAILKDGFIELDFPLNPGVALKPAAQADLQPLLDVCSAICGMNIVEVRHSPGTNYLLVRLDDRVDLANLVVDTNRLVAAEPKIFKITGVILTVRGPPQGALARADYDFISRYFEPWRGNPEDHVCGSAHTVSAPYWTEVLGKKVKKARMVSKRGGDLRLDIRENGRIGIAGTCKVILRGQLTVSAK